MEADKQRSTAAREDWHSYRAIVSRVEEDFRKSFPSELFDSLEDFASAYPTPRDRKELISALAKVIHEVDEAMELHKATMPSFRLVLGEDGYKGCWYREQS